MGYRQAAVLAADCFCLGVLFICFNVDYRVLFTPLTDDVVRDGFEFYKTFYNAPSGIKALLHAVMGVGALGLLGKLGKWDESAMFFDGSSLVAWVCAIAVYLTVGVPATRTVADPVPDVDTRADQVEALRVLSAGNVIAVVLLGAILVLQAGEEYARRVEEGMRAKLEAESAKLEAEVPPAGGEGEEKADAPTEESAEDKKDK
ncbi:Secretory component protein [Sparassis crispa]|uniref:Secretory component protein n=1 Tax=Sparassis crispa TaxID=139825 RepID=A0A401GW29_9APHY|nr:Secretory component protein [Sparassis crispa]GBE86393.1 Secretory component protein [Sparassis crispa]